MLGVSALKQSRNARSRFQLLHGCYVSGWNPGPTTNGTCKKVAQSYCDILVKNNSTRKFLEYQVLKSKTKKPLARQGGDPRSS